MINNYSEIIKYDEGDEYFDEFLKKIHLMEVFKCLLEDYPDKKVFTAVVKFILFGYSIESDMLTTSGLTWDKLSDNIFKRVGLDEKYYDDVARLENDNVRLAIDKWLQLQNNENWTQYILYRDLRKQFLAAALFPLPKSNKKKKVQVVENELEVDIESDFSKMKSLIEAKFLAATNSNELLNMMQESLQKFIQNDNRLKTSVKAMNNANGIDKKTASVEDFLHNKHQ